MEAYFSQLNRIAIALAIALSWTISAQAQDIKFNQNSELLTVKKGDKVTINADTAYVISVDRAKAINERIKELDEVKALYNNLAGDHNQLIVQIDSVQMLLTTLQAQMQTGSNQVDDSFQLLIDQLEQTTKNLKASNKKLKDNNEAMKSQVDKLQKEIKELRKQTRKIWWNGLADKLVAFAGGIGVGILAGLLL